MSDWKTPNVGDTVEVVVWSTVSGRELRRDRETVHKVTSSGYVYVTGVKNRGEKYCGPGLYNWIAKSRRMVTIRSRLELI